MSKEGFPLEAYTIDGVLPPNSNTKQIRQIERLINGTHGVSWAVHVENQEVQEGEKICTFIAVPKGKVVLVGGTAWDTARGLESNLINEQILNLPVHVHPVQNISFVFLSGLTSWWRSFIQWLVRILDPSTTRATENKNWSRDMLGVSVLHQRGLSGSGVLVGHPDTGATEHKDLKDPPNPRLHIKRGKNYFDPKMSSDGRDPLIDGILASPGHGTGTGSVLMSGVAEDILGVAPEAEIIPYRVTNFVALIRPRVRQNLADAIRQATSEGCQIISISLGWLWGSKDLREAICEAVNRGVIVLAAAGQVNLKLPLVVPSLVAAPARYPEVIGIAACTHCMQGALWSARGPSVSATAPGEDVWVARWTGSNQFPGQGSGTSFAVAHVAGVAALWLEQWDHEFNIHKITGPARSGLFRWVLDQQCFNIGRDWGSGFVDARKVVTFDWTAHINQLNVWRQFANQCFKVQGPAKIPEQIFDLSSAFTFLGYEDQGKLAMAAEAFLDNSFHIEGDSGKFLDQYGEEIAYLLYTDQEAHAQLSLGLALELENQEREKVNLEPVRAYVNQLEASSLAEEPFLVNASAALREKAK